jgi:hypothetical protein
MIRKTELAKRLGISDMTVRNRAIALRFDERYEMENGTNHRIFSDYEAEQIENYKGDKRGRKRKG